MKNFKFFLRKNRRRFLLSALSLVFLAFHWLHGPIRPKIEFYGLETATQTQTSSGLINQDERGKKTRTFGVIPGEVEKGESRVLITEASWKRRSSGLINMEEAALSPLSEENLRRHAQAFLSEDHTIQARKAGPLIYAEIRNKSDKPTFLFLENYGPQADMNTFSGEPIHIGVFVKPDGSLESVNYIFSHETESYMRKIRKAGFYEQFAQVSLRGGKQKIDSVSGATISCRAIADTVTAIIAQARTSPLNEYVDGNIDDFEVRAVLTRWYIVHISMIFLIFLFFWQKRIFKSRQTLLILSLLSIVYIGFFMNNSFTYVSLLHFFLGTALSLSVALFSLFSLLGAIWDKNTYCRCICPFGNAQRLMLKISPFRPARWFFSSKIAGRIRVGLTLFLIAGILFGLTDLINYEIFPDFFAPSIYSPWFWTATCLLLISMKLPVPWCRLLCPTGAVLGFISKAARSAIQSKS